MSLRWGEERKGRVCKGARGLTLLFSLRRIDPDCLQLNGPYAKVAHFGVAYFAPLQVVLLFPLLLEALYTLSMLAIRM